MRFESYSEKRVQERLSQLAALLACYLPSAMAIVVERLQGHVASATVYRMFNGQSAWTESAALCLIDLLFEEGKCGPNLLSRLFDPAEPTELLALGPRPETVRPHARSVVTFHNGPTWSAEKRAEVRYVISGLLPPEVTIREAVRPQVRAATDPFPDHQVSLSRGVIAWMNLLRDRAEHDERLQRFVYVAEATLSSAMKGDGVFSNLTLKDRQSLFENFALAVRLHPRLRVGLINEACLKPSELQLLRGQMHILHDSLSDPTFRVQWPGPHAMIHYWDRRHVGEPVVSEREAAAFQRITAKANLTHEDNREASLVRVEVLAKDAGLTVG